MGRPSKYSPEFRAQAVREVIDKSRTIAEVARELGVVDQTLGGWVTAHKREHAGEVPEAAISEPERTELARLRKEVRELKLEKEFLGKAAAFFAKEYR